MVEIGGTYILVAAILIIGLGCVALWELRKHYIETGRQEESRECKALVENAVANAAKDAYSKGAKDHIGTRIKLIYWFENFPEPEGYYQVFRVILVDPDNSLLIKEYRGGASSFPSNQPEPRTFLIELEEKLRDIKEGGIFGACIKNGELVIESPT